VRLCELQRYRFIAEFCRNCINDRKLVSFFVCRCGGCSRGFLTKEFFWRHAGSYFGDLALKSSKITKPSPRSLDAANIANPILFESSQP